MRGGLMGRMRGLLLGSRRAVMLSVTLIAGLLVAGTYLIDEGEIVEVKTIDVSGRDHITEVWIVDLPSGLYLRAGSPDAAWLERVRDDPEIVVTRGEQEGVYRAVVEDEQTIRAKVNAAMSAKYGFADRLWGRFAAHDTAVPIRLVPSGAASLRLEH